MLLSHIICQCCLVICQCLETVILVLYVFGSKNAGSNILFAGLLILNGFCGMLSGILISIVCGSHTMANYITTGKNYCWNIIIINPNLFKYFRHFSTHGYFLWSILATWRHANLFEIFCIHTSFLLASSELKRYHYPWLGNWSCVCFYRLYGDYRIYHNIFHFVINQVKERNLSHNESSISWWNSFEIYLFIRGVQPSFFTIIFLFYINNDDPSNSLIYFLFKMAFSIFFNIKWLTNSSILYDMITN